VLRAACERDLKRFCESYFANTFALAWSDDHLRVIAKLEDVVLRGGLFAYAMPRGSGKSTLIRVAALWALLYGHRRFVVPVAATQSMAVDQLKAIKTQINFNAELARDFRQVCYPIIRLENNGRKAIGQLFNGQQTQITWAIDKLSFPIMPDSACDGTNVSGSILSVGGLTAALRGMSHTLPDGSVIRPDLVILDDPQTRESACSRTQTEQREAIVKGDVLGMAGPGQEIAAFMPCTVIRKGDLADSMLDRAKNPEWNGQLTKMVYAFPTDMDLWERYWTIRKEGFEQGHGGEAATEFYREHREEMDAGSRVAWPERFNPGELSAIQHAMNLRFRNAQAFFAEYQNDPLPDDDGLGDLLTADEIATKVNRMRRGLVPVNANRMTAFIDVQKNALYYIVAAWEDDFTGYIVDYGTFPDQKQSYFALRSLRYPLSTVVDAKGLEGQIYAGLTATVDLIVNREWERDDGVAMRIDRLLIDSRWGQSTQVVNLFCRQTPHASVVMPSQGLGLGAAAKPMREYVKHPGDRIGLNWRVPASSRSSGVRRVDFDANFWKSFVHSRFAVAMGDRGCLSLYGEKPDQHRLFAEHMTAETYVRTVGRGRTVDEWRIRPEHPDNHWFDCLVGAAVAASMQGVVLPDVTDPAKPKPTLKVSFGEMQRLRKQTRAQA
jgi:hypothetical protein